MNDYERCFLEIEGHDLQWSVYPEHLNYTIIPAYNFENSKSVVRILFKIEREKDLDHFVMSPSISRMLTTIVFPGVLSVRSPETGKFRNFYYQNHSAPMDDNYEILYTDFAENRLILIIDKELVLYYHGRVIDDIIYRESKS